MLALVRVLVPVLMLMGMVAVGAARQQMRGGGREGRS